MGTPGINVIGNGSTTTLTGTGGDDTFSGRALGEFFYTGGGDDWVFADAGDDYVAADLGNDRLDGSEGIDFISFANLNTVNGSGTWVTNYVGVTVDLAKVVQNLGSYLGTKTLYNFENLEGSAGNDKLYGNAVANIIFGGNGNDYLDGRAGKDTTLGGDGADTLVSSSGADVLAGQFDITGANDSVRDYFRYSTTAESGRTTSTRDTIWGAFAGTGSDKIDLSRIDANGSASGNGVFKFIGTGNFHSNSTGEVQVKATTNANEYLVKIDVDTDADFEMSILVRSTSALTASDFIL